MVLSWTDPKTLRWEEEVGKTLNSRHLKVSMLYSAVFSMFVTMRNIKSQLKSKDKTNTTAVYCVGCVLLNLQERFLFTSMILYIEREREEREIIGW